MAKISAPPQAKPLDGGETVIVGQDGVTRRALFADMMAGIAVPVIARSAAETARDAAVQLPRGLRGPRGFTGLAAAFRATREDLQVAPIEDGVSFFDGSVWTAQVASTAPGDPLDRVTSTVDADVVWVRSYAAQFPIRPTAAGMRRVPAEVLITEGGNSLTRFGVEYGVLNPDNVARVQAAIDDCLSVTTPKPLLVPGPVFLDAPVFIDRQVDRHDNKFIIRGIGDRGGFVATAPGPLFDSRLPTPQAPAPDAGYPQSENLRFEDVHLESTNPRMPAYVLTSKFLRVGFSGAQIYRLKLLNSDSFAQDFKFYNGFEARKWEGGPFFRAKGAYNCSSADDSVFEFSPDQVAFDLVSDGDHPVQGCSFAGLAQGIRGFIRAAYGKGLRIAPRYGEEIYGPIVDLTPGPNPSVEIAIQSIALTQAQVDDPDHWPILCGSTYSLKSHVGWARGRLYDDSRMAPGTMMHTGLVEGVLNKSGRPITVRPTATLTTETNIASIAGSETQTGARQLTADYSLVTAVHAAKNGFRLPRAFVSRQVIVRNQTGTGCLLWPLEGDRYSSHTVNEAETLPPNATVRLVGTEDGVWGVA